MNNEIRAFITSEVLTISEVAQLLNLTTTVAMKRAERHGWDYVLKGGKKLYWRGDFTAYFPADQKQ